LMPYSGRLIWTVTTAADNDWLRILTYPSEKLVEGDS
jgi:hypothetical protein